jgi:PhnB protein
MELRLARRPGVVILSPKIPTHMKINTYLHFDGNCDEALKFYERALGAKRVMTMRYGECPRAAETTEEMRDKVMHGRIAAGDNVIMASDAPPGRYKSPTGFSINIGVDTVEEAERVFGALSEKGEIHMPLEETFWAHRFGMLVDQFGVPWMVNCEKQM